MKIRAKSKSFVPNVCKLICGESDKLVVDEIGKVLLSTELFSSDRVKCSRFV